jgi:hypothetical protein
VTNGVANAERHDTTDLGGIDERYAKRWRA